MKTNCILGWSFAFRYEVMYARVIIPLSSSIQSFVLPIFIWNCSNILWLGRGILARLLCYRLRIQCRDTNDFLGVSTAFQQSSMFPSTISCYSIAVVSFPREEPFWMQWWHHEHEGDCFGRRISVGVPYAWRSWCRPASENIAGEYNFSL